MGERVYATRQGSVHTVRCYPYFSMALLGVLGRLVDNTAKQRLGGGGLAAVGSKVGEDDTPPLVSKGSCVGVSFKGS
jgi:hypothetical protein